MGLDEMRAAPLEVELGWRYWVQRAAFVVLAAATAVSLTLGITLWQSKVAIIACQSEILANQDAQNEASATAKEAARDNAQAQAAAWSAISYSLATGDWSGVPTAVDAAKHAAVLYVIASTSAAETSAEHPTSAHCT